MGEEVDVGGKTMSAVSATIPWQEGKEEDFAELREGLRKLREGELLGCGSESDSSGEEGEGYGGFRLPDESDEDEEEEEGEDPGEGNPNERILWAAQHNKIEVAKEMLLKNAKLVGARDSDLYTPLHRASYNNHLQMVKLLLHHGADPLATTEDGWTPLHSAAKWNCVLVAELLLLSTPVNCVTRGGQTPLHLACLASSSRDTVELLLSQPEVDPGLKNSQGDTAREVAARTGNLAPLFDCVEPRALRRHKE